MAAKDDDRAHLAGGIAWLFNYIWSTSLNMVNRRHRLKHNFERGKGFVESHCCTIWIETEPDDQSWVQEVKDNDRCEMFAEVFGFDNNEERCQFPSVVCEDTKTGNIEKTRKA